VDQSTAIGKRDYTMLMLMAVCGLGGAEIRALTLDDVNWHEQTLRVVRCKTGTEFLLPLIDPIAIALSSYLENARPRRASAREIFLGVHAPHRPLSSSLLQLLVKKYASLAGVTAPVLGPHSLRHSHACRQVELGAPPKAISDILGHEDARSSSAYIRVDTKALRMISLPVP